MSKDKTGKKVLPKNTVNIIKYAVLVIIDILTITVGFFLALFIRFDFNLASVDQSYIDAYLGSVFIWAAAAVIVFFIFRLYSSIWSFAGAFELLLIFGAYCVLCVIYIVYAVVFDLGMPRAYYAIGLIICFGFTVISRFAVRLLRMYVSMRRKHAAGRDLPPENVMIIGAGAAGEGLIHELRSSDRLNTRICCVIDDDAAKKGKRISGVYIAGGRDAIIRSVKKYKIDKIIFAIPSIAAQERKKILEICKETDCKLQTLPGIYQIVNCEVNISQIRDVDINDLLGREQIEVNADEIFSYIAGKTVMITGGGGSIGSELCRQIAAAQPRRLIIFDIYENNAYDIQQELLHQDPELPLTVLIGSVRDGARMKAVMNEYRPDILFHAAAHKHVPLMEDSPYEAVKNNVIGTWKCAQAAAECRVRKFVLISTDKAVNPTSVMGASKRMCEMIVQMMDRSIPGTDFVAVRFGNVLGSNGSVIPLFKKQIAAGGPVTVTDKNITRYFMTIPEAVSLVLQAVYYADGGEIFVLEMGDPVKIDDMARNLIRLSGLVPDVDIQIVYTGLRPGEKLYEELLMDEEGLTDTKNRLIHIGRPLVMDDEWFTARLKELDSLGEDETERLMELIAEIVPAYRQ